MGIEYRNINAIMVTRGRKLKDLLQEDTPAYKYRDGRMWMPASLGMHLIRKHGRIIQRSFLP